MTSVSVNDITARHLDHLDSLRRRHAYQLNSWVGCRVKEEMNILRTKRKKKERKANWMCHIFRTNCLLKHVTEGKIEGKIEGTGRQGRRRKQLLIDLTDTRRYWKLKAEALYRTLWSSRFGRSYGPLVRETT